MAMAKKTTKKTQKKVIINKTDKNNDTVEVSKPLSDEDKIFGLETETVTVKNINYESEKIKYKVTNLKANNKPVIVTGMFIETFIGSGNLEARKELKRGEKVVITHDAEGEDAYKLEVQVDKSAIK